MGKRTAIEYCDSTCNPVVGCTGCELYHADSGRNRCYAADLVRRFAGQKGWPEKFTSPQRFSYRLERALGWSDLAGQNRQGKPWLSGFPRIVFVNDLGDGFCPSVDPEKWLSPFLDRMASSPHIWLLLTKWPARMAEYFQGRVVPNNFWLGTTVTNQKTADQRISHLLRIDGGLLWLSLEPLLEAVDLSRFPLGFPGGTSSMVGPFHWCQNCGHWGGYGATARKCPHCMKMDWKWIPDRSISWIVAGGESGRNARPAQPDSFRAVRDLCLKRGVPFFFKQWGAWLHRDVIMSQYPEWLQRPSSHPHAFRRFGKKDAGRLLDGLQWSQMPSAEK